MIFVTEFVAAEEELIEVCDIEGSSCPDDTYCCEQTVCDSETTDQDGENKRKTQCCGKAERDTIPRPVHCSKCAICGEEVPDEDRTGITII